MAENSQKNNKGRPNNNSISQIVQQARQEEVQYVKQYWTQHRITLIAYEVQYMRDTKPQQNEIDKGKVSKKKNNLEYESGFLMAHLQNSKQINIDQKMKQFRQLMYLKKSTNEDQIELSEFIRIMLDLKHESIVLQFMQLYNAIAKEIKSLKFQEVKEEQNRQKWINQTANKIISFIKSFKSSQKFVFLNQHLNQFQLSAQKLIKVQIYCFVAEKFNFNINEYYSEAFDVTLQMKSTKKIKTQLSSTD